MTLKALKSSRSQTNSSAHRAQNLLVVSQVRFDAIQDSPKLALFNPRVICQALTVRIGSRLPRGKFACLAGLSAAHRTRGNERSYGIHALSCQTLVKKYGQS